MREPDDIAILILAGGRASRCPGKLERPLGTLPMLTRLHENLRGRYPVYVSANRPLCATIASERSARIVFDRRPGLGPLCGLVCTLEVMTAQHAFVVAGDMPFVDLNVLEEMRAQWLPGDQALVTVESAGAVQPLLALYDRRAFLQAATPLAQGESRAVKDVLVHLRWRSITLRNPELMLNVNTEDDYRAAKRRSNEEVPA